MKTPMDVIIRSTSKHTVTTVTGIISSKITLCLLELLIITLNYELALELQICYSYQSNGEVLKGFMCDFRNRIQRPYCHCLVIWFPMVLPSHSLIYKRVCVRVYKDRNPHQNMLFCSCAHCRCFN